MLLVLTSAEQACVSLQSGKSYRLMPALRVQPASGLQVRMHSHLSDHFWLSALEKKVVQNQYQDADAQDAVMKINVGISSNRVCFLGFVVGKMYI